MKVACAAKKESEIDFRSLNFSFELHATFCRDSKQISTQGVFLQQPQIGFQRRARRLLECDTDKESVIEWWFSVLCLFCFYYSALHRNFCYAQLKPIFISKYQINTRWKDYTFKNVVVLNG
jgi:hypothetical protein